MQVPQLPAPLADATTPAAALNRPRLEGAHSAVGELEAHHDGGAQHARDIGGTQGGRGGGALRARRHVLQGKHAAVRAGG
jgi:hypothetical protein